MVKKPKTIDPNKGNKRDSLTILSYNVNGLRSVLKKNFISYINRNDPDIIFLSETKTFEKTPIVPLVQKYPFQYFNPSIKKGYSSTALFSKTKPISVSFKFPDAPDGQGRMILAQFPESFYIIGLYVLNSGQGLKRLESRTKYFDLALRNLISNVKKEDGEAKILVTGDMNVAYYETDVYNPNDIRNLCSGFTNLERENFAKLLREQNLIDVYPYMNKDYAKMCGVRAGIIETKNESEVRKKAYTYYNVMKRWERGGYKGWRLDYFIVTPNLVESLKTMKIDQLIDMSDHVPTYLELEKIF